jgi:hypothetical protein
VRCLSRSHSLSLTHSLSLGADLRGAGDGGVGREHRVSAVVPAGGWRGECQLRANRVCGTGSAPRRLRSQQLPSAPYRLRPIFLTQYYKDARDRRRAPPTREQSPRSTHHTPYSPGGGTTAHSVLTSRKPVPTTPYSRGGGTTAHSVLTSHNTPVPTTP